LRTALVSPFGGKTDWARRGFVTRVLIMGVPVAKGGPLREVSEAREIAVHGPGPQPSNRGFSQRQDWPAGSFPRAPAATFLAKSSRGRLCPKRARYSREALPEAHSGLTPVRPSGPVPTAESEFAYAWENSVRLLGFLTVGAVGGGLRRRCGAVCRVLICPSGTST
jgi:hypothetical protein